MYNVNNQKFNNLILKKNKYKYTNIRHFYKPYRQYSTRNHYISRV